MTRAPFLLMFGFLLISLGACSLKLERGDVIGEYVANYPFGVERLQLKPDGTYMQTVTLKGKTAGTGHSGTWDYAPTRDLVVVHGPLQFGDPFGKLNPNYEVPMKGTWNLTVSKTFGNVSLTWNEDAGVKFEKLKER